MSILATLLNMDVSTADAMLLEQHYGNVDEKLFIDCFVKVGRAIIDDMPQDLVPPAFEPWSSIITFMLIDASNSIRERFDLSLLSFADDLRTAIGNAVQSRVNGEMNWRSNNQKTAGQNKDIAFYVRTLERLGYKFRMNLCDDNIEVNGEPISDWMVSEIRGKCKAIGLKKVQEFEDAYIAYAGRNGYHPVKEYLLGCRYDQGAHIETLASCFGDEYQMIDTWLKKFLVGSVAKVLGNYQNRMLVLDGGQGLGKSSFVRWLAGGLPLYFHEGQIDTFNRKDTEVQLMGTWIWEVSELGGTMAKAEMNALKAILSQQWVKVRKAYGRHEVNKPAMASFIGTINNEAGFLNDYTGSRRYMVAKLTKIDWSYTKLRVDDIWAQAVDLYRAGFNWTLDEDERGVANEINENYTIEDVTQSAILKYFEIDSSRLDWFLSTLDIAQILEEKGIRYGTTYSTMLATGRALSALGLARARIGPSHGKREQGYRGIRQKTFGIP